MRHQYSPKTYKKRLKAFLMKATELPAQFEVADVKLSDMTLGRLLNTIDGLCSEKQNAIIGNHNLHSLYLYHNHEEIRSFYQKALFNFIDGMPLVWLARAFGVKLNSTNRITYVDLLKPLLQMANERHWHVFFVGGKKENLSKVISFVGTDFPNIQFHAHNGYFDRTIGSAENTALINEINSSNPHVLLVGMGMPVQEEWIANNHEQLSASVTLNCGACFDYFIGIQKQPPRWLGPIGLEWLFRLYNEPQRLYKRYLIEPLALLPLLISKYLRRKQTPTLLLLILLSIWPFAYCQAQNDTAVTEHPYSITSVSAVATKGFQPFYHEFNQQGIIPDNQANSALMAGYHKRDTLKHNFAITNKALFFASTAKPYARIQNLSSKISYYSFFIKVGRFTFRPNKGFPSSGNTSLFLSNNAVPIPQFVIGSNNLTFSKLKNRVALKGHFSIGYLGNSSVTLHRMFHHKSAGIRLGHPHYATLTATVNHSAIYGGTLRSGIKIPNEFWNVFLARRSDEWTILSGEKLNRLGSHIGVYDLLYYQRIKKVDIRLHYQYLFEDNSGRRYFLKKNPDGLYGINVSFKQKAPKIKSITYEYVRTTYQSGEGLPDTSVSGSITNGMTLGGRDDYYNNYLYRDGYTYKGLVMANPLILTYNRTLSFWPAYPNYGVQIVNNRLTAHHIEISGFIRNNLTYKINVTLTTNFGTYTEKHGGRFAWKEFNNNFDPSKNPFNTPLNQTYSAFSISHQYDIKMKKQQLETTLSLAYDTGDMYQIFGTLLSIKYKM
ncbi:WecB/TagA/CpsF family glycosyltransferase [bacterium]|nr:WecB/TagA/CpsF family glycosyltransferase [bacterium]